MTARWLDSIQVVTLNLFASILGDITCNTSCFVGILRQGQISYNNSIKLIVVEKLIIS